MTDWLEGEYRLKRGRNKVAIIDLTFNHSSLFVSPVITSLKIAYRTRLGYVMTDWVMPDELEAFGSRHD